MTRRPAFALTILAVGVLLLSGCATNSPTGGIQAVAADEPAGTANQQFENGTDEIVVNETSAAIAGTILNENGAPIPSVSIILIGIEGSFVSDREGKFVVNDLAPADYIVRLDHPEYKSFEAEVTVQAGKVTAVEFVLISLARSSAGFREHYHDLWGGEDRKLVFDGVAAWKDAIVGTGDSTHAWACVEQTPGAGPVNTLGILGGANDCHRLPVLLPSGTTILPGTREITAKVTWKSSATLSKVRLVYLPANDTKQRFIEIESGQEGSFPVEFPMQDHGHAQHTLWAFHIDARPALGPIGFSQATYNEQQIGDFQVQISILKGEVPAEAAHKRYWVNGSALPLLVDKVVKMDLGLPYSRTPYACFGPPCVTLPPETIVPPGTSRLRVEMRYWSSQSAIDPYLSKKTLAFRTPTIQPSTATLEDLKVVAPLSNAGGTAVYELTLEPLEADAFYQLKSLWAFYIAWEGREREEEYVNECNIYFAGYGCGSNFFEFNVIAYNDDWTPELAG